MLSLKEWRRAKDVSQKAVADFCGVHVNTYLQWEKEPQKIPLNMAHKIAECIDVPFGDIDFLSKNSTKNVEH